MTTQQPFPAYSSNLWTHPTRPPYYAEAQHRCGSYYHGSAQQDFPSWVPQDDGIYSQPYPTWVAGPAQEQTLSLHAPAPQPYQVHNLLMSNPTIANFHDTGPSVVASHFDHAGAVYTRADPQVESSVSAAGRSSLSCLIPEPVPLQPEEERTPFSATTHFSYRTDDTPSPTPCVPGGFNPNPPSPESSNSDSGRAISHKAFEKPTEDKRRARRRALVEAVGFEAVDPDIISTHDKKRLYLQCLEEYAVYLQKQLTNLNVTPRPLQKVDTYSGISNQSLRTLLVHMEHLARERHEDQLQQEYNYVAIRNKALTQMEVNSTTNNGGSYPLP